MSLADIYYEVFYKFMRSDYDSHTNRQTYINANLEFSYLDFNIQ